jgi:hypothetical protein
MSKVELSPTQQAAVEHAKANGGALHRKPGGFWASETWTMPGDGLWFGTTTVEALVRKGIGKYTEHLPSARGGEFPVKMELCDG